MISNNMRHATRPQAERPSHLVCFQAVHNAYSDHQCRDVGLIAKRRNRRGLHFDVAHAYSRAPQTGVNMHTHTSAARDTMCQMHTKCGPRTMVVQLSQPTKCGSPGADRPRSIYSPLRFVEAIRAQSFADHHVCGLCRPLSQELLGALRSSAHEIGVKLRTSKAPAAQGVRHTYGAELGHRAERT